VEGLQAWSIRSFGLAACVCRLGLRLEIDHRRAAVLDDYAHDDPRKHDVVRGIGHIVARLAGKRDGVANAADDIVFSRVVMGVVIENGGTTVVDFQPLP
jgi:hypothetical protein